MPLDIIPIEEQAVSRSKAKGGDIWATHKRIDDVSLYERFGQIRRVPIEAQTTYTHHDVEFVEPRRMDDYHALQNKATGGLLNVRPVGKTYALVPHDLLFKAQAEQNDAQVDQAKISLDQRGQDMRANQFDKRLQAQADTTQARIEAGREKELLKLQSKRTQ
jgi:hypothetical protein